MPNQGSTDCVHWCRYAKELIDQAVAGAATGRCHANPTRMPDCVPRSIFANLRVGDGHDLEATAQCWHDGVAVCDPTTMGW